MVVDENRAAVFLAQLELAVHDAEESVALTEYRAPRVSERRRARLGRGVIRQTELCFKIFHGFVDQGRPGVKNLTVREARA